MPGVHVVTDSSCDLAPAEIEPFDVEIVPLTIRFGDDEYTDRSDLSVGDFYDLMARTEELPQTACPSPGAFEEAFRRAGEAGADAVACLTISSDLSNTLQSARTAAKAFDGGLAVQVIDSRTVSSGLGTLVLEAAGVAQRGGDIDAVRQLVDGMVPRTHVMAVLNTLENLKKGGRIGGAKALLGSMLSIKPVIDLTGGEVHEAGKGRTRTKALHLLADRLLAAGEVEHVAVMHGGAADIDEFLAMVAPRFPRADLRLGELGAVIGAHGGAEIIGVSWVEG
jgi:DegV family protein with EDD domain